MEIRKTDGFFASSNGIDRVVYSIYHPEGRPRAILQVAHGMSEHFGRYREFAEFMASHGFLVCGNDHLGHGMTAPTVEDLGYFGPDKGWIHMADDMYLLTKLVKSGEYGRKEGINQTDNSGLPYFLLGHSMGSMLARCYITCYGEKVDGVILAGSLGKHPSNFPTVPVVKILKKVKGDRHTSLIPYVLAFGSYNRKYDKSGGRIAWMSQDREVLKAFKEDPRCNFYFTLSGFWNLHELIDFISRKEWAEEVPKNLPVLILSGDMDPVGGYGKGIHQTHKRLAKAGVRDLQTEIYPGLRHEILHEPDRKSVFMNILNWMERRSKIEF